MPSPKSAARLVVRVSNDAFLSMAFSAAEAAVVAPDFNCESYKLLAEWEKERGKLPIRRAPIPPSLIFSETGREVGGVLFGDIKRTTNQTTISVAWAMPVTAIASDEGLAQSGTSSLLLADLAEAAGRPFGSVVADFHSHPLLAISPKAIEQHQLYSPSDVDLRCPKYPNCCISLIITIAWAGKAKPKISNQPGLGHRRLGEFDFYLTVHSRSRTWSAADPTLEIRLAV